MCGGRHPPGSYGLKCYYGPVDHADANLDTDLQWEESPSGRTYTRLGRNCLSRTERLNSECLQAGYAFNLRCHGLELALKFKLWLKIGVNIDEFLKLLN